MVNLLYICHLLLIQNFYKISTSVSSVAYWKYRHCLQIVRREEVVLTRFRMGHTYITQDYSICISCRCINKYCKAFFAIVSTSSVFSETMRHHYMIYLNIFYMTPLYLMLMELVSIQLYLMLMELVSIIKYDFYIFYVSCIYILSQCPEDALWS